MAFYELADRYLIPRLKNLFKMSPSITEDIEINKKKGNEIFNTGFNSFLSYSKKKNILFTIYLHADRNELNSGSYNKQGKEIIEFAKENNIPIILDLENGLSLSDFRDGIHINCTGQKKLAATVMNYIDTNTMLARRDSIQ